MLTLFSVPNSLLARWRSAPQGPKVGEWTVIADASGPCRNALLGWGRCLEYEARTKRPTFLVLQMKGVDRS